MTDEILNKLFEKKSKIEARDVLKKFRKAYRRTYYQKRLEKTIPFSFYVDKNDDDFLEKIFKKEGTCKANSIHKAMKLFIERINRIYD